MQSLAIKEVTPDLLDDYLYFFDHVAFVDFPWWSGCYCLFFCDPEDDGNSSPETIPIRRPKAIELVRAGRIQGLLAYIDGGPVGWCNAAPRATYATTGRRAGGRVSLAIDDPNEPVGSTVCFVVGAQHRGKGIATALLAAALEKFRRIGLTVAEGYPNTAPPTGPYAAETPSSAHNYHGPLEIYLKAGFSVHKRLERFAVVRRSLIEAS